MNTQLWIVIGCVILALSFIIGRMYRSVKKGGCNCECEKIGGIGTRKCQGGGECPNQKKLREIARP